MMNIQMAESISCGNSYTVRGLIIAIVTGLIVFQPMAALIADTRWTPSIKLQATHDDNIQFTGTDAEDDSIYSLVPEVKFNYAQELTKVTADGRVGIRRYQEHDELNDEIYELKLQSDSKVTERFFLSGKYEFIKDTTLDSELQETGRVFSREDRLSHDITLIPGFNLTERTSIGLFGRFRDVRYDSESNIDYSAWDAGFSVRRRLATEVDTVYISPGYSHRESDTEKSESYNLRIGWDHETTERLTLKASLGARYTEFENVNSEATDKSWGGLGALKIDYDFEIGNFKIDFEKDLTSTATGDQVDVSRIHLQLKWYFSERIGMDLEGRYYYTNTEGRNNDYTTEFMQAGPDLFYHLTEHHIIFIAYEYSQEYRKDAQDEPRAERNRIWAGIRFSFPL